MSQVSDARATFIEMFLDSVVSKHPELGGDDKRAGLRYLAQTVADSVRATGRAKTCDELVSFLTQVLQVDADKASDEITKETIEKFRADPRVAFRVTLLTAYHQAIAQVTEFGRREIVEAPSAAPHVVEDQEEEADPPFTSPVVGKA
jgi:hypothetical protein